MYSKKIAKLNFQQQQYPFFTTCNPSTLKFSGRMISANLSTLSAVSRRTSSVVVPIKSSEDENYYEIPEKQSFKPLTSSSSSSSYWSWTFGMTIFPFISWGIPIHHLLTERPPIRTTRSWLKCLFDCSINPLYTLLTCILLILTAIVNIYFFYLFSILFNSLFIAGVYETSMFFDLIDFLRDIPIIIPLNFVWLRGFKINNIVLLLNKKHRMFSQIACSGYRIRLIGMMIVTTCVHIIRYFSYKKYSFTDLDFFAVWHTIWNFSVDIFVTLTFPVYCTFCYAIRFELSTIKASVYEMISKRETPKIYHLSKFKMLYTHAADHIIATNQFFSIYMSLTIVLTIVGTIVDAENLVGSIGSLIVGTFANLFGGSAAVEIIGEKIGGFMNDTMSRINLTLPPGKFHHPPFMSDKFNPSKSVDAINQSLHSGSSEGNIDPVTVRQINADIACIVLMYILIIFTVWQAVVTNDWAREVHVWLDDFVAGAGGTDVKATLMGLGVVEENDPMNNLSSGLDDSINSIGQDENAHQLIWARNRRTDDGQTDQFLEKFHLLKSYIHVRMQLEVPALLYISLVGVFLPSLSGRLKRYNVMF